MGHLKIYDKYQKFLQTSGDKVADINNGFSRLFNNQSDIETTRLFTEHGINTGMTRIEFVAEIRHYRDFFFDNVYPRIKLLITRFATNFVTKFIPFA